ncbi:iron ABC transporter permease [Oceanotoga sp. DSM 15011]|uniref:Iron complex transport system permease protein n=1 Tax=Oceanotoga teriensis TaxID=515440 RepID=A0AA45C9F2_9BACT|nr:MULTISPECIES: iron ABC transporter permease [Oceanotoga]MDN5342934.1 cobalamin transport system permease protein [Oceanotoga sp.]MDO7975335.1 iron ABC transporter permease [Oceanotoga teriensis]PWJ96667.1 iron complex transport system permease protein [Oceanotoga teriensis]UYP00162.1 iron ABC transporter permease [Oceanotoga sp. DSM 15011]
MKKYNISYLILFLLLFISIVFYTSKGFIEIPFFTTIKMIFSEISNNSLKDEFMKFWYVIFEVRIPRILTSTIAGAALGLSGLIFQAVLLNPLADPYILGVSSGASFGAALALLFNIQIFGLFTISFFSFMFAILSLILTLCISYTNKKITKTSLILSGIIVNSFFSAGLSFMKYLADEEVGSIVFWLMGSFTSKSWDDFIMISSVFFPTLIIIYFFADKMNILSLGDRNAKNLGINTTLIRVFLLIIASLLSAIVVSRTGIIGFVGLIIPHICRFIWGSDNKKLIFYTPLVGALLLSFADNFIRIILPVELPIGILTSLTGAPFFVFVMRKKIRRHS